MQKVNTQILLASTLLFSIPAHALIILQQASLPMNVDYDSNLNLSSQKQGVWRYSIVPKYSVALVDEKNKFFSDLALTLQRSSDKKQSVDRKDPSLKFGWQRQLEKGDFSITAGYDKRSSRFAQFNTNALLDVDGTSVNKSLVASYSHALSARLKYSLGASYSKTAYTSSSFIGSTSKTINGTVTYDYNELMSPFVQFSFTDFKPDGNLSQPSTSKNFSIGSSIMLAPRWTFSPSVGINSTSTSGTNNSGNFGSNGSSAGSGWIANTSLNYVSEKSTILATLARSVVPGGLGSLQKTDSFSLGYSRDLSEISRAGVNFNLSKSQSNLNSETTQFYGFYSRDLSQDWQLRLNAGHRSQKQNAFSASNNNIGISLIYNIPQF